MNQDFWASEAKQIEWREPWTTTLDWQLPNAKWFVGGKLNVTETCLDRHLQNGRADKLAIIWEAENGEVRRITYAELHGQVCNLAFELQQRDIKAGDRVAIYMPLTPEAIVAMLACARIGAIHSVIFGGFSAESVRDRVNDASCVMVITSEGGYRKGKLLPLKETVDKALENNACPSVKHVMLYPPHPTCSRPSTSPRSGEVFDSEHPLFILYTSGTTGKPKGIVHSSGGYLTQVASTTLRVFNLQEDDIYWCTADVGWITGHSYVCYGPLACGATIFLYEGAPLHPTPDRFWQMIARHRISILYTAPTAIRTFMRLGDEHIKKHDLSSLRLLGSVGEPINPEVLKWYAKTIGGDRCPVIDTWWQTETGAMMIVQKPLPGIEMKVSDGILLATQPWPSMARGIWADPERFKQTYWSQFPGSYFTGDGAHVDENGNWVIEGRIDDVLNVSGHRIGTAEVESALVTHCAVAEAAVVARPDEITGQAIVAFVILKDGALVEEKNLMKTVAEQIGAFARPAEIRIVPTLPKTRSGKIMRRLLRELATHGKITGDTTTLED